MSGGQRRIALVRYISPFGSPAYMPRADAERHLANDDRRWLRNQQAGVLSTEEQRIGPPRIERVP